MCNLRGRVFMNAADEKPSGIAEYVRQIQYRSVSRRDWCQHTAPGASRNQKRQKMNTKSHLSKHICAAASAVASLLAATASYGYPIYSDTLPPAFSPSVPYSGTQTVVYEYEYVADGFGGASCTLSGAHTRGFTREHATTGGNTTLCRIIADMSDWGLSSACSSSPVASSDLETYNCLTGVYSPDSDGSDYNFIINSVVGYAADDAVYSSTSGTGWTMEQWVAPSYSDFFLELSDVCSPCNVKVAVGGWSAYYKIIVTVQPGYSAPALPSLPVSPRTDVDILPRVTITKVDDAYENYNNEGPFAGLFQVERNGSTANPLTVYYSHSGTASSSTDYSIYAGTLGQVTIPSGQSSAWIEVLPVNDFISEGSETVIFSLIGSENYMFTSPYYDVMTIYDTN